MIHLSFYDFRVVAETSRILHKMKRPQRTLSGCLAGTMADQWPVVHFFYSPSSPVRLSDEDLREIFFHLTDAYPSEIEDNPDLIMALSRLSQADKTTVTLGRVSQVIEQILSNDRDNEQRAMILQPLYSRINEVDMRSVIRRLSFFPTVAKRTWIISALAIANDVPFSVMRRSCLITGLNQVAHLCSIKDYDAIIEAQTPRINNGIIIPTPLSKKIDAVRFSKCLVDSPQGEFITVHKSVESITIFDSAGHVVEETVISSDIMPMWSIPLTVLPNGVYLAEYADGREMEVLILDCYTAAPDLSLIERREQIPNIILKPMQEVPFPKAAKQNNKNALLLWNPSSLLTYENTQDEVVLIDHNTNLCVFRVLSGIWGEVVENGGIRLAKWRIGAVDADDYMPVGVVEASVDLSKELTKYCEDSSAYEGENVALKTPVFVEVDVISSGFGVLGGYVQGQITSIARSAGKRNVVRVEQLDFLNQDGDFGDDEG